MLTTFTGFRGRAALVQFQGVEFFIVANTQRELETIYRGLYPDALPLNEAACKRSVVISNSSLPANQKAHERSSQPDPQPEDWA